MPKTSKLPAYEDPERDYSMTIEQIGDQYWRVIFTVRGTVVDRSIWSLLDAVHQKAAPRRKEEAAV
jgi:hypothetical protein